MADDLPAFERPAKATSAPVSVGQSLKVGADIKKVAFWICFKWSVIALIFWWLMLKFNTKFGDLHRLINTTHRQGIVDVLSDICAKIIKFNFFIAKTPILLGKFAQNLL